MRDKDIAKHPLTQPGRFPSKRYSEDHPASRL